MKDIEQRAEELIKSITVNSANLDHISTTGRINGSLYYDLNHVIQKAILEEREIGKRFAEWMNKNKYHWSVLFKAYNNIDEVGMWSYDDLFNQFLLEEEVLNN